MNRAVQEFLATNRSFVEASVIDAAFRCILEQDWGALATLQRAYPHLALDPSAGWTIVELESYRGVRGAVTWNAEENAFAVEAPSEPFARWIGFRVAEDDDLRVTWWGTRQTPCGTWAAQFTVGEEEP